MRLHLKLLTLGLATSVAVPVVLTLPVATAPAATPHPVAPHVQHLALRGVDAVALADAGPVTAGARLLGAAAVAAAAAAHGSPCSPRRWTCTRSPWSASSGTARRPPATAPSSVQVRTRALGRDLDGLVGAGDLRRLARPGQRRVRSGCSRTPSRSSRRTPTPCRSASTPPSGAAPAGLQLDLVDPGYVAGGRRGRADPGLVGASAAAGMPAIVTRAQWGADESLRDRAFKYTSTVKIAVVHHTASGNSYWQTGGDTLAAAAKDLRAIYAYSVATGYADVPYNFLVDQAGRIYEGRAGGVDKAVLSAATGGFNTDTMSISALGNFQTARPSSALVAGIERIAAWKLGLFHRDPTGTTALISAGGGTDRWPVGASVTLNNISGHRDTGATACPGSYLYPYLPDDPHRREDDAAGGVLRPGRSPPSVVPPPLTTPMTLTTRTSAAMSYQLQVLDSTGTAVRTYRGSTAGGAAAVPDVGPERRRRHSRCRTTTTR